MTFVIEVAQEAKAELQDILDWYDAQHDGLGAELLTEVNNCYRKLLDKPLAFQTRYRDFRLIINYRFPIAIHYTVRGDVITVLSIIHTKQDHLSE